LWAEWIAEQITTVGYTVAIQQWHISPSEGAVATVRHPLDKADKMIVVLSQAYLTTPPCTDEWTTFVMHGDQGRDRLLPVRVEECQLPSLLQSNYVDFVGAGENAERQVRLMVGVQRMVGRSQGPPPPNDMAEDLIRAEFARMFPTSPDEEDAIATALSRLVLLRRMRPVLNKGVESNVQRWIIMQMFTDLR
jgi:hypothetical protein